jgi:DNA polymerase I
VKRERRLLAVDLSNQVWRNLHANHALRSADGKFTGALYGFLVSLAAYIRDTEATDVVVCLDSKPYVRSLTYPDYKMLRKKQQRPEDREAYEESVGYVHDALDILGLPVMAAAGFEADDCIARLAVTQRNRFKLIVAASSDSDLHQLLWVPNFLVMGKSFAQAVSSDTLFANTGLTPEQFMIATALQGTHNDVAGIPGVGESTAAKAVRDPALMRQMREKHRSVIDRNLGLIRLPHADFPPLPLPTRSRAFNPRAFFRFLGQFDIEATKSMLDAFETVSRA